VIDSKEANLQREETLLHADQKAKAAARLPHSTKFTGIT
jgi:hypothetical protein